MPQIRIPKVLLFDVNETLLDLAPVKRTINGILKTEQGAQAWFYSLLHHSLVVSAACAAANLATGTRKGEQLT